jgi:hypothetical protein
MMKVVACLALVLLFQCFCLTSARPNKASSKSLTGDVGRDVELFLEGMAVGLEIDIGNVTECTKDANVTLGDFEKGFRDLENGINQLSRTLIERGLVEWAAGVLSMAKLLQQCGFVELAQDIYNIATEIMSGPAGIFKLVINEIVDIFYHGRSLINDFKLMISSFKAGDYYHAGVATGEILGILLQN